MANWVTDGITVRIPAHDTEMFSTADTALLIGLGITALVGMAASLNFIIRAERAASKGYDLAYGERSYTNRIRALRSLETEYERNKSNTALAFGVTTLSVVAAVFFAGYAAMSTPVKELRAKATQESVRNAIIAETGGYVTTDQTGLLPTKGNDPPRDISIDGNRDSIFASCAVRTGISGANELRLYIECDDSVMQKEFPHAERGEDDE